MTVNDVIQVKIEMHDGYGHQKTIGGDLVIGKDALWITENNKKKPMSVKCLHP